MSTESKAHLNAKRGDRKYLHKEVNDVMTAAAIFHSLFVVQGDRGPLTQIPVGAGYYDFGALNLYDSITTLSAAGNSGRAFQGLLYVPALPENSGCYNSSKEYVPENVPRKPTGPTSQGSPDYIAFAPWISKECTLEFLQAAGPYRTQNMGFITYLPDNGTTKPPSANDPKWVLNDGGNWRGVYRWPVYAIPGRKGAAIMDTISKYGGDAQSAPNSERLLADYPFPDAKFRVSANIEVDEGATTPSLWLFLLIVIASLGGALILTSMILHWRARRRRESLRRLITSGELSLDTLGVKKLTVPQDAVNKMPVYTYVCDDHNADATDERRTSDDTAVSPVSTIHSEHSIDLAKPTEVAVRNTVSKMPIPLTAFFSIAPPSAEPTTNPIAHANAPSKTFEPAAQPSCPICLDDYISHESIIRQLPCAHIFHPECIDKFLTKNSALCPMCKTCCLPRGYCPPLITSMMMRREREIRFTALVAQLEAQQDPDHTTRLKGVWRKTKIWYFKRQLVRMDQRMRTGNIELALRRRLVGNAAVARNANVQQHHQRRRSEFVGMSRQQRLEVRRRELAAENRVSGEQLEDERPVPRCKLS